MHEFLQAFWPNLSSTILGVILGLPVAVYVNERVTRAQRQRELAAETTRRDAAADVLIRAFDYNRGVLENMRTLTREGRVMRNPDLQVTTWEAIGPILSPICTDPALLQRLSHHWLRLNRLDRLNEEVFARTFGTLPPLTDDGMMGRLWVELHDGARDLAAHAGDLAENLTQMKVSRGQQIKELAPT